MATVLDQTVSVTTDFAFAGRPTEVWVSAISFPPSGEVDADVDGRIAKLGYWAYYFIGNLTGDPTYNFQQQLHWIDRAHQKFTNTDAEIPNGKDGIHLHVYPGVTLHIMAFT